MKRYNWARLLHSVKQGDDSTPKEFKANTKQLNNINKTTLLLPQPIECIRLKQTRKVKEKQKWLF